MTRALDQKRSNGRIMFVRRTCNVGQLITTREKSVCVPWLPHCHLIEHHSGAAAFFMQPWSCTRHSLLFATIPSSPLHITTAVQLSQLLPASSAFPLARPFFLQPCLHCSPPPHHSPVSCAPACPLPFCPTCAASSHPASCSSPSRARRTVHAVPCLRYDTCDVCGCRRGLTNWSLCGGCHTVANVA